MNRLCFLLPFLQVSETCNIRTKSTSDTVSCHSSYCEMDKYPSSFTGPHNSRFPFFCKLFYFSQQELVGAGGGSGVEGLATFGPYHATVRFLWPQVQKSPQEQGRAIRIPGHVHSSWTSRNINRKVSQRQPGRKRTITKQQLLKWPCVIKPLSQPRTRDDSKSVVSNIWLSLK